MALHNTGQILRYRTHQGRVVRQHCHLVCNCPANLPDQCDGCGAGLMLEHGLSCKKGSLVGIRYDDVHDEWAHLCSIALTNSSTVIEPAILYGNRTQAGATNAANATTTITDATTCTITLGDEARGDILAHSIWN